MLGRFRLLSAALCAPRLPIFGVPARSVYVSCFGVKDGGEDDNSNSTVGAFDRLSQKLRREGLMDMLKKREVRSCALLWRIPPLHTHTHTHTPPPLPATRLTPSPLSRASPNSQRHTKPYQMRQLSARRAGYMKKKRERIGLMEEMTLQSSAWPW